ncbi:hypothetical protein [Streptomyces sp. NBC_01431]|uniref:hypothetical protein n=1 Tax=Streptomyces sp. NBC_01431 TaxID=2903863 RepID=UPI002E326E81|nr:hypothetical protein [Streptomyces sp. NBC_01431]
MTTDPYTEALAEYGHARQLHRAVIAAYSARIASIAHEQQAADLKERRRRLVAEQQTLSDEDRTRVRQILAEFPGLLAALRAGAQ